MLGSRIKTWNARNEFVRHEAIDSMCKRSSIGLFHTEGAFPLPYGLQQQAVDQGSGKLHDCLVRNEVSVKSRHFSLSHLFDINHFSQ